MEGRLAGLPGLALGRTVRATTLAASRRASRKARVVPSRAVSPTPSDPRIVAPQANHATEPRSPRCTHSVRPNACRTLSAAAAEWTVCQVRSSDFSITEIKHRFSYSNFRQIFESLKKKKKKKPTRFTES